MTTVLRDDLWLCEDCLSPVVNGDFTALDYHYSEPKASLRMEEISAGMERLSFLVADFDSETGEGILEFATKTCDCCGVRHGGTWHRFAQLD